MEQLRDTIEQHWRRLFNFAFRMTLSRTVAREVVTETFMRAYVGASQNKLPERPADREAWLLRIATHVIETKGPGDAPEVSFDLLDDQLRSEATRTEEVRSLTDPQRNFMLWELKQGCMTSVVNCLSTGERVAFVMSSIMGMGEEDAANALGITPSAFKVRLSRARKKVSDYLAPRCEHVDPRNPCHCPSRLGVAMNNGFLPPPAPGVVSIRQPYGRFGAALDGEDTPRRDVMAIYGSLPEPDPPGDLVTELLRKLESGEWASLAKPA